MKNKRHGLFLWASFTLFALSVIVVILNMIVSYYKVKTEFPTDDMRITDELVAIVLISVWIIIPSLASELSCIRSVYKILKYEPTGYVKLCYIISASLAFLSFSFQWLIFVGLINLEAIRPGENFTAHVLLFTQWPSFILSFVLGSIPIGHISTIVEHNSNNFNTTLD